MDRSALAAALAAGLLAPDGAVEPIESELFQSASQSEPPQVLEAAEQQAA